jgi:hypothetical protein
MRDFASNRLNRCKNTDSFNTCDMLKSLAGPRSSFFCLSHVLFPILPATMIPTDSYLLGVFQSPSGKTSVTSPEYHNVCCHPIGAAEATSDKEVEAKGMLSVCINYMAMDQYLLIPFLVGWTSIYQLFWCSPGVQGFDTLPYVFAKMYPKNISKISQVSRPVEWFVPWSSEGLVS